MTPEEYRILFGEDPPDERGPAAARSPASSWTDTRAWWRKKRFQFPASILLMIVLLSIDDESDPGAPAPTGAGATPTASP